MNAFTKAILFGSLNLLGHTAAQTSTGQACPSEAVSIFESCDCPAGTQFQISTTYATLGVNAKDFYNYTASFHDLTWLGIPNLVNEGPDFFPGSLRTFDSPTPEGNFTFTEKLDSFHSTDDGSYFSRSSQSNVPIEYASKNGSFSGYWIDFDAEYATETETVLKWTNYACFTGNPFDYGPIHVQALTKLLATMQAAGLVNGNTTGPYYTQNF